MGLVPGACGSGGGVKLNWNVHSWWRSGVAVGKHPHHYPPFLSCPHLYYLPYRDRKSVV